MRKLLLLAAMVFFFTGCLFDSDTLEFEDIVGTWSGQTKDLIWYEGSYLEAYYPVSIQILYPDPTNSRIMDIISYDPVMKTKHALGEVLHMTVTETRNNIQYKTYDGLLVYDISNVGSDTMGLASMMYFYYDDIATGEDLWLGVSKIDSELRITIWEPYMRQSYPDPGEKPYIDYFEQLN